MSFVQAKKLQYIVLLSAIVASAVLFLLFRLSLLELTPPGFFVDESSIGYNAVTILQTGADEHGVQYPLYFKAFGDYKNPIFIYSVVPLLWLFGISVGTVRFAAALWGLGAVWLFAWWARQQKFSRMGVAVALLIAATNPWLLQLSRVSFEIAAFPAVLLAGVILAHALLNSQKTLIFRYRLAALFGLSMGVLFYTYTAARVLSPALLFAALPLFWKTQGWKTAAVALGAWLLCLVPLWLSGPLAQEALVARYGVVGISNYVTDPQELVVTVTKNYFLHFTPDFLFNGGDHNLRHIPEPYGVFFLSTIFFFAMGIYTGVWKQRSLFFTWALFGFLLAPLPAALTIQSPHALRAVGMVVFYLVFCWQGVRWWDSTRNTMGRTIGTLSIWFLVIEALAMFIFLNTRYPLSAHPWFDTPALTASAHAARHPEPYYLSQALYPGTQATLQFSAAQAGALTPVAVTLFDSLAEDATKSAQFAGGTIMAESAFCNEFTANNPAFITTFDNSGICVATFTQESQIPSTQEKP